MFDKRKDSTPSVILNNITVKGDIVGDGNIHIDGTVEGDISVSNIILGDSSVVKGIIEGNSITISGEVLGTVKVSNVHLLKTSRVYGDVFHDSISIESGAMIHGRCINRKEGAAIDVVSDDEHDIEIRVLQQGAEYK